MWCFCKGNFILSSTKADGTESVYALSLSLSYHQHMLPRRNIITFCSASMLSHYIEPLMSSDTPGHVLSASCLKWVSSFFLSRALSIFFFFLTLFINHIKAENRTFALTSTGWIKKADVPYWTATVPFSLFSPPLSLFFALLFSLCLSLSGNLGSQLIEYKEEMYITNDCGKTWRQVRKFSENKFGKFFFLEYVEVQGP